MLFHLSRMMFVPNRSGLGAQGLGHASSRLLPWHGGQGQHLPGRQARLRGPRSRRSQTPGPPLPAGLGASPYGAEEGGIARPSRIERGARIRSGRTPPRSPDSSFRGSGLEPGLRRFEDWRRPGRGLDGDKVEGGAAAGKDAATTIPAPEAKKQASPGASVRRAGVDPEAHVASMTAATTGLLILAALSLAHLGSLKRCCLWLF